MACVRIFDSSMNLGNVRKRHIHIHIYIYVKNSARLLFARGIFLEIAFTSEIFVSFAG